MKQIGAARVGFLCSVSRNYDNDLGIRSERRPVVFFKSLCISLAITAILIAADSPSLAAQSKPLVELDPYFTDGGVIQRDMPVVVRGTGPAGATVVLRANGGEQFVTVDGDGRWEAHLSPDSAGQSIELTVREEGAPATAPVQLVYGDVWLCSGQSNMDLEVRAASNISKVLQRSESYDVRLFKIERQSAPAPAVAWSETPKWRYSNADTLQDFSAACWHMGTHLSDELGIPIGLVQASWGGASIEDWLSSRALGLVGGYEAAQDALGLYARDESQANERLGQATINWVTSFDPGELGGWHRPGYDDTNWGTQALPGAWENSGIEQLARYDGTLWYRRTFTLADGAERSTARLTLGRVDERDTVFINGEEIGSTLTSAKPREYEIPAGLLQAGSNTIAIRVIDHKGGGGLSGHGGRMAVELADGSSVSLDGSWNYRVGTPAREWPSDPPLIPWATPRGISMMFNGMIAPLEGINVKGVAWYQGESNASEHEDYASLLRIMIADWRVLFRDPDLPFVVVQLPGYGPLRYRPSDPPWARLRDAQRVVAESDDHIGLAVTLDLGIPDDIHPTHKNRVGERMAREALRIAYGRSVIAPTRLTDVEFADDRLIVSFDEASAPLRVMGAHSVSGFELCTSEGCRFVIATASGRQVRLSLSGIDPSGITEIRYAWQPSPIINLFNADNVPVGPFRVEIR